MDKEKEIEELTAKIIERHCYHHGCDDCSWKHSRGGCEEEAIYRDLAHYLIEEDYRPADEVRKETLREIDNLAAECGLDKFRAVELRKYAKRLGVEVDE